MAVVNRVPPLLRPDAEFFFEGSRGASNHTLTLDLYTLALSL